VSQRATAAELDKGVQTQPGLVPPQPPSAAPVEPPRSMPPQQQPVARSGQRVLWWSVGALCPLLMVGVAGWLLFFSGSGTEVPDDADNRARAGKEADDVTPPEQAIKPPAFDGPRLEVKLPGMIGGVAVGGAGRYLVLHLPYQRNLALFDVNEAKVVHYFPLAEDSVKFAAGSEKLVIVYPVARVIQRWCLKTLQREVNIPLPINATVHGIALGSASRGPVLPSAGEPFELPSLAFLDMQTMKPIHVPLIGDPGRNIGGEIARVRVSADGCVFAFWQTTFSPQGIRIVVLTGGQARNYYEHDSAGHLAPGPNGKYIYSGHGVFTNEGKPVGRAGTRADRHGGSCCVPAHHGNWYLTIPVRDHFNPEKPIDERIGLHLPGREVPLLHITGIDLGKDVNAYGHGGQGTITTDQRIHFIPNAKVIVTVAPTNDRLVLHRFDVDEALEKSGMDYLFVTSCPRETATTGKPYRYQIAVKSK
jgi:hypothetical protein